MPEGMSLPPKIRSLLDEKCGLLKVTKTDTQRLFEGAFQQQIDTGIKGHENLKTFAALKYFALFDSKVKAAHTETLVIIDSCNMWDPLSEIPPYVNSLLKPFAEDVAQKVKELTGNTPHSPEMRNISDMYLALKWDFDYRAKIAIRTKRKDFWSKAIWVPVIGLVIKETPALWRWIQNHL